MQVEQLRTTSGQLMEGPLLITPQVFGDDRGFFFESWNQRRFDEAVGSPTIFCQDNHSRSSRGVLRGLHYQLEPEPQGKLVRNLVQGLQPAGRHEVVWQGRDERGSEVASGLYFYRLTTEDGDQVRKMTLLK